MHYYEHYKCQRAFQKIDVSALTKDAYVAFATLANKAASGEISAMPIYTPRTWTTLQGSPVTLL